ncbi:hypothetical protein FXO38_20175 [Capsicum annuum]|nr:hypothetical protein FXO38_20175 [Capsicum annuum]KAF3671438.1 hypothetical protein FXO37_08036 [Capsicum annuum]
MKDLIIRVNNLEKRLDQQITTLREELTKRFEELVVLVRNNQGGVAKNRRQHRAQYVEEKDCMEEHDLYAQPRRGHANSGDMYKIKAEIPTFNGNVNSEGFLDWIYEIETFCEIMNIPPDHRVPLVAYKLKGVVVALWNCHQEELHLRGENRYHNCVQGNKYVSDYIVEFLRFQVRSMGRIPFSIVVDLVKLPTRENSISSITFSDNYSELFKDVQDVLEAPNKKYKQLEDMNRRLMSFQVGDHVMVYLRKEILPTVNA